MTYYKYLIFLFLFTSIGLDAQLDSLVYELKITSTYFKAEGNVIRWAPSTPGYWRICNYYGYKIERADYDSTKIGPMDWQILESHLKPKSLEDWRTKVAENKTDTFLMVAGQAIHGTTETKPESIENMIAKSDELANLYSACVISAEYSRNAALYSALRYDDKNVRQGNAYLYRITVLDKDSTSYVTLVESNPTPYPEVKIDEIREGERMVELLWNKVYYKEFYSAFNVYKSFNNGKDYVKINNVPIAYTAYKDDQKFIFRDSLTENEKPYYYKIEGLTSYATKGPMSEAFKAQGKDKTAPDAPYNIKLEYLGNAKMKISWEVNPMDKDIEGFRISKSNETEQEFVEVTKTMINGKARSYIDSTCNEMINNYYWIAVFDKQGNVNVSTPQYGTIKDSIPPAAPTGVTGTIDTNGVVTVKWNLGSELDLKGYYVHYSNNKYHTFINRTDHPLMDTIWRDTIPLNVLTEEIYYKVVAIDHRYNYSPYSEMLTLKKPDLVPPTSPVFTNSISTEDGIELKWNNSQSHDVVKNVLTRKKVGEKEFTEIYSVPSYKESVSYIDKKIEPGVKYEYQLFAVDDAGLKSKNVGTISVKAYESKTLPPVKDLKIKPDTKAYTANITWSYKDAKKYKFVIYRSVNDNPYLSYKVIDGQTQYDDKSLKKGDKVKYRIKAINEKGWQSDFSDELTASYLN